MSDYYNKAEIFVWMPMLGLEKNDPDKGAARIKKRMSFTAHGMSVFLFHPDIVMQHSGMDHERVLPPDNCAYYGNPYNNERKRQEWTNYDVRTLATNLKVQGTEPYLGFMGTHLNDTYHQEWLSAHPEIMLEHRRGKGQYNVLKRFNDGTYFEDLFIKKLVQTVTDYGFTGIHATDCFSNYAIAICDGDFSTDMVTQFTDHTGIVPPEKINQGFGDNSELSKNERGDWIWKYHRQAWIKFYAWRWSRFWKKVCDAMHAINKKVIALSMYCTDPFETLYCLGNDLKKIQDVGMDYYMPNYAATSLRTCYHEIGPCVHRQMNMITLTSAFAPDVRLLNMMAIRDVSEEWDLIHHMPCSLERDIYSLAGFLRRTNQGYQRCLNGFMICLGDGLEENDWQWLLERFDSGFYDDAEKTLAPAIVWSDQAFYNTLPAYIESRRWTLHKIVYETENYGGLMGSVVRIDDVDSNDGVLFVPNFDLLPDEEKQKIASYNRGAVICTCSKESYDATAWGIRPDLYFEDEAADYQLCTFTFGDPMAKDMAKSIEKLIRESTGFIGETFDGKPEDAAEYGGDVLRNTLKFNKVSVGFVEALALLVKTLGNGPFSCNLPMKVIRLNNGHYRIHIINPLIEKYDYAVVSCQYPYKDVTIISSFQLLPVKFMNSADEAVSFVERKSNGTQKHFRAKIGMDGATLLDVEIY